MLNNVNNVITLFDPYKIGAYIIPSNDQYFSEYPPESSQRLKYITNFSGSNGLAVIGKNKGLFFTDGRYLEQSKQELDLNFFNIFNINNLSSFPWDDYLDKNTIFGYDPKLFTPRKIKAFSKIAERLLKISDNLVDKIWDNKPTELASQIELYDLEFAGQLHSDKIIAVRKLLVEHSADAMIITSLDSICWLLNIRARDIAYSPLFFAKVLFTQNNLYLFTNSSRVDPSLMLARLEITILAEENFEELLLKQQGKILIDENFTSLYIIDLLNNKLVENINDPCQLLKACKNNTEIKHAIDFHIQDGVALCEFFAYLLELPNNLLADHTEYRLAEILTDFRSKQLGYIMDSFATICGFKENSAIIHYRATELRAKKIVGQGLLLIDSGGQYKGCTTDVTRTFAIGTPTFEQKLRYTQVLKGHLALSMIKFPEGTINGSHLDILARQFLWRDSEDYPHSTGHGVGSFLNVHEGPQAICMRNNVMLKPGMILSNEPGYYKTKDFGIRIENLMYVKRHSIKEINSNEENPIELNKTALKGQTVNYLKFDTLTLVPYAKELIDFKMLSKDEKDYIKNYYQKIKEQIYPLLSSNGKKWLAKQLFL